MSFVKAKKGNKIIKVSKKSYESMFKSRGYTIVEDCDETEVDRKKEEYVPEVDKSEDVEEIPISNMSKSQLMEYAKQHNIDTSMASSVKEAREIIKEAVRELKM